MTLPLLLALHLGYGVAMAHTVERRVRAEGAVLGVPLVFTMLPVACVSVPFGAVLLRWAGGWFLHGAFLGEAGIAYERFHLGLMLFTGAALIVSAAGSFLMSLALLSREQRRASFAPAWLAGFVALLALALARTRLFVVAGAEGATVFTHPVGLVSSGIFFGLLAAWLYARARLAEPVEERP